MRAQAGTGTSTVADARAAGIAAAEQAVSGLQGATPELAIVFTTPRYDLQALLDGIRSVTGAARLVGATGSGEMVNGDFLGFGAGVAVLVLSGGNYRYGVASASHIKGRLDEAGREIARASHQDAGASPYSTIVLLADALLGDLQQLVQGIYRVTGPKTALVGGAAGDELKFIATFVFHDGQVVEEGAVALWIASDHPLPVVTRHGWEPIGVPLLVTRAEGTEVIELGGQPAAEAYEGQLDLPHGGLSVDTFWGTSIYHPLGLLQTDGEFIIRVARAKNADGVMRIQGCVPPAGSAVQVMEGNAERLLGIVEDVAATACAGHPEPAVLVAFSCAARATIFKDRTPEEASRLQAAAHAVPTFGIYCCGEFARTAGVLGTHNATLTALAL